MSLWKDAQSPALKTEEAALMTALPRHMAQGAALKTVLRAGKRMEEMRLSGPVAAGAGDQPTVRAGRPAAPARSGRNRAAQRQVWKR